MRILRKEIEVVSPLIRYYCNENNNADFSGIIPSMERLKRLFSGQIKNKNTETQVRIAKTTVETAQQRAAQVAARYFTNASVEFPAAVIAQAARITQFCKQSKEYNPDQLGQALIQDDGTLDKLVAAANKAHSTRGNGPKSDTGEIKPVDKEQMTSVIQYGFHWAQRMMVLDQQGLDHVLTLYRIYKELHDKGMGYEAEIHYRFEVLEMIKAKHDSAH